MALRFWLLKLNSSDSTLIAELTKITGFILLIGHLADFYELTVVPYFRMEMTTNTTQVLDEKKID